MIPLAVIDWPTVGVITVLGGTLFGGIVAVGKMGPERTSIVVTYQAQALDDLQSENERLIKDNTHLRDRLERIEQKCDRQAEELKAERRQRLDLERRIELIESGSPGTRSEDIPPG